MLHKKRILKISAVSMTCFSHSWAQGLWGDSAPSWVSRLGSVCSMWSAPLPGSSQGHLSSWRRSGGQGAEHLVPLESSMQSRSNPTDREAHLLKWVSYMVPEEHQVQGGREFSGAEMDSAS